MVLLQVTKPSEQALASLTLAQVIFEIIVIKVRIKIYYDIFVIQQVDLVLVSVSVVQSPRQLGTQPSAKAKVFLSVNKQNAKDTFFSIHYCQFCVRYVCQLTLCVLFSINVLIHYTQWIMLTVRLNLNAGYTYIWVSCDLVHETGWNCFIAVVCAIFLFLYR